VTAEVCFKHVDRKLKRKLAKALLFYSIANNISLLRHLEFDLENIL